MLLILATLLYFRGLSVEWIVNPQYSYGWWVPGIAVYLFLKRWKSRPKVSPQQSSRLIKTGIWLSGLAVLPLSLFLEANPDWRFLYWAASALYLGFVSFCLWYAGGLPWLKHFSFPVLFLLLATPWPWSFEKQLIQSLTHQISLATVETMRWLGHPASLRGNIIQLMAGDVGVNEACSGIRSIQTSIMLAIFFGELYRLSISRRFLLVGIGVGFSLVFNYFRTVALTWTAAVHGPEAQVKIHDTAGIIALAAGIGALFLTTLILKRTNLEVKEPEAASEPSRTPLRLLPLKSVIMATTWLLIVEVATVTWYRLNDNAGPTKVNWAMKFPDDLEGLNEEKMNEDVAASLRCDSLASGIWKRSDNSEWTMYFISWKPGRLAAQNAHAHRPENCLPPSGFNLVSEPNNFLVKAKGIELPFSSYVFEGGGQLWYVYFCLVEDGSTKAPQEEQWSRWRAVKEGRRQLGQNRIEIAMVGYPSESQARKALVDSIDQFIIVQ